MKLAATPWLVLYALAGTACSTPPVLGDVPGDSAPRADVPPGTDVPQGTDVVQGVDAARDAPPADAPAATTAVLRVHYPAGSHTVSVRGASGPWNWTRGVPAAAGADDTWTYTTTALTGETEWKPLLDDATWSRGPNYRVAPGQTVDVYPHFTATSGQVVRLIDRFHSDVLNNDRVVWAYLPPTYGENSRASFPVVYMHDGQNLFDPAMAFGGNEWRVDETLDQGAEDGSIAEAVVVAPENNAQRIYEYTPSVDADYPGSGGGSLYLRMLADELRPRVESMLRVRRGPANTGLLGSSLGGLISAWGGLHQAGAFGLIGVMSPSTWWDNNMIIGAVTAGAAATPRAVRVYLDSGDSGPSNDDVTQTRMLADAYRGAGYVDDRDLKYVVQTGGMHNEFYWAQRLPGALRFLLGPRAN